MSAVARGLREGQLESAGGNADEVQEDRKEEPERKALWERTVELLKEISITKPTISSNLRNDMSKMPADVVSSSLPLATSGGVEDAVEVSFDMPKDLPGDDWLPTSNQHSVTPPRNGVSFSQEPSQIQSVTPPLAETEIQAPTPQTIVDRMQPAAFGMASVVPQALAKASEESGAESGAEESGAEAEDTPQCWERSRDRHIWIVREELLWC